MTSTMTDPTPPGADIDADADDEDADGREADPERLSPGQAAAVDARACEARSTVAAALDEIASAARGDQPRLPEEHLEDLDAAVVELLDLTKDLRDLDPDGGTDE